MNAVELKQIRQAKLTQWFSDKPIPEKEKSYISQLKSGKGSFGEKAARRLEQTFNMPHMYLDTPTTTIPTSNATILGGIDAWDSNTPLHDDDVEINFYKDIRLAAGNGFADDIQDYNDFKLRFSKATLRRHHIQPEYIVCVTANGDSMEPVLPDGTTVGINTINTNIKDGKMYAINHGGLLRIKILYLLPNGVVRIKSYNSNYEDETDTLENIHVIGEIFWWSVLI